MKNIKPECYVLLFQTLYISSNPESMWDNYMQDFYRSPKDSHTDNLKNKTRNTKMVAVLITKYILTFPIHFFSR